MISYEWTVEAVTADEYGDVIDNDFRDTYREAVKSAESMGTQHPGSEILIGLVRDRHNDIDKDLEDRQWAYLDEDGKLPKEFDGGARVPVRYIREVER